MNKYKYKISNKADQGIWVCEACKKGKIEFILTGKWKLIDRSNESEILCAICDGYKVAGIELGPVAAKNGI